MIRFQTLVGFGNHLKEVSLQVQNRMASSAVASPTLLRPLILQRRATRFLLSRKKSLDKWSNHASGALRLSHLHLPHSHPPALSLSLCHRLLLPPPPFPSMFRPRSPHFRHSLSLMTTTPQAASDSAQSSPTKTVITPSMFLICRW